MTDETLQPAGASIPSVTGAVSGGDAAAAAETAPYLLEVKHLKKYFPLNKNFFGKPRAYLKAVDDVSFRLAAGRTVGIVGESGCGKTTMGRTVLRLYDATGGEILFEGTDLVPL